MKIHDGNGCENTIAKISLSIRFSQGFLMAFSKYCEVRKCFRIREEISGQDGTRPVWTLMYMFESVFHRVDGWKL